MKIHSDNMHGASVRTSARIDAPPERVYGIIADYRNGHPHILPKAFRNLVVEVGGVGAGTIINFEVRALGMTRKLRAKVTEPQPGCVLVETNVAGDSSVSTFTVEPVDKGRASDVTIETRLGTKPGIVGSIERMMSVRFLKALYREELALLERTATKNEEEKRNSE